MSFGMSLLRRRKGENEWFMRKRNNCCDSFKWGWVLQFFSEAHSF